MRNVPQFHEGKRKAAGMHDSTSITNPCPCCGRYLAPSPTVDAVIHESGLGIVLVKRKNPPFGWALPGGFIEYGECAEIAAVREAREETGLDVVLTGLLGVYSDPGRDPRMHTISTVFIARASNPGDVAGGDDAAEARFFRLDALPRSIAFDHAVILDDFVKRLAVAGAVTGKQPLFAGGAL